MVQKQRKIGQQIMAVRMIWAEQEKAYSFMSIDTIANAMGVPEDEVRELIECCRALYRREVIIDVIISLEKRALPNLIKYRVFLGSYVDLFYRSRFNCSKELDEIYINSLKECIKDLIGKNEQIDEIISVVEDGYILFGKKYVEAIEEMRSKGYDWAVIAEMFGKNHMWRKLFEGENAEDNFARLKEIVEQGI